MCQTYREARETGCACTRRSGVIVVGAGCLLAAAALQEAAQRVAASGLYQGVVEAAASFLAVARAIGTTAAALVTATLLALGAAAVRREARRMLTENPPSIEVLDMGDQAPRRSPAALPPVSEVLAEDLVLPEGSPELMAARLHSGVTPLAIGWEGMP